MTVFLEYANCLFRQRAFTHLVLILEEFPVIIKYSKNEMIIQFCHIKNRQYCEIALYISHNKTSKVLFWCSKLETFSDFVIFLF